MAHTGIRLRIVLPGAGPILDADSDWLHMKAQVALLDSGAATFDQLNAGLTGWHQILGGSAIEIWIQPTMLPDSYADDEDQAEDDA